MEEIQPRLPREQLAPTGLTNAIATVGYPGFVSSPGDRRSRRARASEPDRI